MPSGAWCVAGTPWSVRQRRRRNLPAPGLAREQALLELNTRGTHVLLSAAVDAGVGRCLCAGTLAVLRNDPDDVCIGANWCPLPAWT